MRIHVLCEPQRMNRFSVCKPLLSVSWDFTHTSAEPSCQVLSTARNVRRPQTITSKQHISKKTLFDHKSTHNLCYMIHASLPIATLIAQKISSLRSIPWTLSGLSRTLTVTITMISELAHSNVFRRLNDVIWMLNGADTQWILLNISPRRQRWRLPVERLVEGIESAISFDRKIYQFG